MVFDVTKPQTKTRLSSVEIRDNFNAVGRASDLKCFAQDPPDLTVFVQPGRFSTQTTSSSYFAGGGTADIDTLTGGLPGQERIVVVEIDPTGDLQLNYGSWMTAGTATAPTYTSANIALCEVTVAFNDQEIIDDMITDIRPLINLGNSVENLIAPDLVTIVATDALGPGLGQRSFDTSSSFTFIPNTNEVLVWSNGIYQTPGVDYDEPSINTVRFNIARPAGERVTIWKVGISASPGSLAFAELTDVSADEADAFNNADAPTAINPFLTVSGHAAVDHSTITPIPILLTHVNAGSNKHDADQIAADTSGIAYSSATEVQSTLDDVDNNVYQPYLQEHLASGAHGPKVTIAQTANDHAILINKSGTSSAIAIYNSAAAGGYGIHILNSGSQAGLKVSQTSGAQGIYVQQSGSDYAIHIAHDSEATGFRLDHESPNYNAQYLTARNYGLRIDINDTSTRSDGWGIRVNQYKTDPIVALQVEQTGNTEGVYVKQAGNSGSNGAVLIVQENTSSCRALRVDHAGSDYALYVNKNNAVSGSVVRINNDGSGYDIEGHLSRWRVDKNGNADFGNVAAGGGSSNPTGFFTLTRGATLTINSTGGIVPTHSYHCVDTYLSAGIDSLIYIEASGVSVGTILILQTLNDARDVIVRNELGGSGGNLDLSGDFTMDRNTDCITLIRIADSVRPPYQWVEVTRSNNETP